jgi:hypothetical protein
MMHRSFLIVTSLALAIVPAGCGGSNRAVATTTSPPATTTTTELATTTTTELATTTSSAVPAAHTLVLRYSLDGGCQVLGRNCPTYTVYLDGAAEVTRTGTNEPAAITGSVHAADVAAWWALAQHTDYAALRREVGPGSCQSCVDGDDVTLTVFTPSGAVLQQMNSVDVRFDPGQGFFASLEVVISQVRALGQLPVREG